MLLPNGTQTFCEEFDSYCQKLAERWSKLLRKRGSIAPKTVGSEPRLSRIRTWTTYVIAVILHYYLPEKDETDQAFKFYIRQFLYEQRNKWGSDNSIVAHTILKSQPQMLCYLLETSYIAKNPREIFGLLGKQGKDVSNSIVVYWTEPKRPSRQQRIRGYRDHGSLRPEHQRLENFGLTEEARLLQEEIERRRQSIIDSADFLDGGCS